MSHEDYQSLGLTALQADVIYALMQLGGEASAPEIIDLLSTAQKVNRTSIYSVLSKLQQMGVVISNEERSSNYALISTSTEKLVEYLTQQHEEEVGVFRRNLQNAKAKQKRSQEFELYYLRARDQILAQVELLLGNPQEYVLIMANAPVLKTIFSQVEQISNAGNSTILVLPTWNPDPSLDFNGIIKGYQELLSKDCVAKPLPLFDRVLPMMRQFLQDYPPDMISLSSQNCFVQILTKNQWVMATYLDGDTPRGSGIYSREPMISQMMHILFMSIIEQLADVPTSVIDEIMSIKTSDTMDAYVKQLTPS